MCDESKPTDETTAEFDLNAKMKTKKASRTSHRSSATKMIKQVDPAIASVNTPKLKQLRAQLTDKAKLLATLDEDIVTHLADSELEKEVEQADLVQEKISIALFGIEEVLEEIAATIKWCGMRRSPLPPRPFEYEGMSDSDEHQEPLPTHLPAEDGTASTSPPPTLPATTSYDPLTAPVTTSHVTIVAYLGLST